MYRRHSLLSWLPIIFYLLLFCTIGANAYNFCNPILVFFFYFALYCFRQCFSLGPMLGLACFKYNSVAIEPKSKRKIQKNTATEELICLNISIPCKSTFTWIIHHLHATSILFCVSLGLWIYRMSNKIGNSDKI